MGPHNSNAKQAQVNLNFQFCRSQGSVTMRLERYTSTKVSEVGELPGFVYHQTLE